MFIEDGLTFDAQTSYKMSDGILILPLFIYLFKKPLFLQGGQYSNLFLSVWPTA